MSTNISMDQVVVRVSNIVAHETDLRSALNQIAAVLDGCDAAARVSQPFRDVVEQQIAHATKLDDLRQRNCGLRYELLGMKSEIETRKCVDRARGILARKHRVSEGEADTLLRRQVRHSGRSLQEVAETIVTAEKTARTAAIRPVRRTA